MRARPIRIEGDFAYVSLTKGYEAIIDAADVPLVAGRNWQAMISYRKDGSVRSVYAFCRPYVGGKQKLVLMHRLILATPAGMDTDHEDCDGRNNTRRNLRVATESENAFNRRKPITGTSGVKGVTWHEAAQKWQAQIKVSAKNLYLGLFDCKETAEAVVAAKRNEMHGAFARLA